MSRPDGNVGQTRTPRATQAERQLVGVRALIVLVNTLAFAAMPEAHVTHPRLAYALLAVSWLYSAVALLFRSYRRFPALAESGVLAVADGIILTLWLFATGGAESPFYIAYYVGITAGGYRFGFRGVFFVAAFYAVCYGLVVFATGGLSATSLDELGLRVAYMFFAAAMAGMLARESLREAVAKSEAERRHAETRRMEERLERQVALRTQELQQANDALRAEVAQRQAAEVALKRAKEDADAASRSKSDFLAVMSHEIRTPLNAVMGFVELLADPTQPEADRLSYAEVVKRNGVLLNRIVSDILDLSKVEAGRLEIERLPVALRDVLAEVAASLAPEAHRKGVRLQVETSADVPDKLVSDPTRLGQILLNLASNALKFTDRGHVTLSARRTGDDVVVSVEDTGLGIGDEQKARLFQPFGQGERSTARRFGGTGLGLALSKRLAGALGGDLTLERSKPGEGSCFSLRLPLSPPRDPNHPRGNPGKPADLGPRLDGVLVLLVDDAPDNQLLIRTMLERAGARVVLAANGAEALDRAAESLPDLILMDLQMPVLDGYEATRRLRARGFTRPIIALTAHAMQHQKESSLSAGCDEHLTKPVDRLHLVRTLRRFAGLEAAPTLQPGAPVTWRPAGAEAPPPV